MPQVPSDYKILQTVTQRLAWPLPPAVYMTLDFNIHNINRPTNTQPMYYVLQLQSRDFVIRNTFPAKAAICQYGQQLPH